MLNKESFKSYKTVCSKIKAYIKDTSFKGANVTIQFKEEVTEKLDRHFNATMGNSDVNAQLLEWCNANPKVTPEEMLAKQAEIASDAIIPQIAELDGKLLSSGWTKNFIDSLGVDAFVCFAELYALFIAKYKVEKKETDMSHVKVPKGLSDEEQIALLEANILKIKEEKEKETAN